MARMAAAPAAIWCFPGNGRTSLVYMQADAAGRISRLLEKGGKRVHRGEKEEEEVNKHILYSNKYPCKRSKSAHDECLFVCLF